MCTKYAQPPYSGLVALRPYPAPIKSVRFMDDWICLPTRSFDCL